MNKFIFTAIVLALLCAKENYSFAQDSEWDAQHKKRDPFVALVSTNGKIKTAEELFPVIKSKPLSMNISVRAIIWDEKRPLVLINNKVYAEGAEIAGGLKVDKIAPNSVTLNDNGNLVTLPLKKIQGQ